MEQLSELGKVLLVGYELVGADRTAAYLSDRVGVSRATLMRYLGDLRHMGCDIVSRREATGPAYRLENREAVRGRLHVWLTYERERSLLERR